MVSRASMWVVLWWVGTAVSVGAQQIPKVPKGVGIGTLGYGIVDSTPDQYSNSGSTKNKLEVTGFGPLYGGLNSGPLAPLINLLAGGPYTGTPIFNSVSLRTRGEVYGFGYTHGIDDKVTFNTRFRFGNMRTHIRGKDTADYARLAFLIPLSGGEPPDDAHMNDRLINSDFNLAFWMDDREVGDSSTMKTAIVTGYTYRGGWDPGQDLVKYALTELARMNRPAFLRLGFQSEVSDDDGGLGLQFGTELAYHMEGQTKTANTATLINNTLLSVGALTGFPTGGVGTVKRPVETVRSEAHYGVLGHLMVTKPVGPVEFGVGSFVEYENDHAFRRVSRTGNPLADARLVSNRNSELRAYLRLSAEWSTIDAYTKGDASVPFVLSLQIDDSFLGRNLSELQLTTLRFSMPLFRGDNES